MLPRSLVALAALAAVFATPATALAEAPGPALTDTYWKLVSVRGLDAEQGRRDAFLTFRPDGGLVGSTGCNNLGAVYTIDGEEISFGPIMTTRMYCQEVADTERRLLHNLPAVARYVIDGNRLELQNDAGLTVAVFEAVAA